MRTLSRTVLVIVLLAAVSCDGGTPTQPGPSAQLPTQPGPQPGPAPTPQQSIEVTGTVTDPHGTPLAGARVTMGLFQVAYPNWPTTVTDASGNYRISFRPLPHPNNFVATAQVAAAGYEEYWRNLRTTVETTMVENVRLSPITRVIAGESIVVSADPDIGDCRGWLGGLCAVVRISVPRAGRLTVEVTSHDAMTERPRLELCCEDGNERYGNPVTVNVHPGPELVMEIGLGQGISTRRSFTVKTSIATD